MRPPALLAMQPVGSAKREPRRGTRRKARLAMSSPQQCRPPDTRLSAPPATRNSISSSSSADLPTFPIAIGSLVRGAHSAVATLPISSRTTAPRSRPAAMSWFASSRAPSLPSPDRDRAHCHRRESGPDARAQYARARRARVERTLGIRAPVSHETAASPGRRTYSPHQARCRATVGSAQRPGEAIPCAEHICDCYAWGLSQ
jgi:hypothetical protein